MKRLAVALLLASVSAPAFAQASHDTLFDAVDSAMANNPELMAQRKTRAVADEVLNQAKAQMGPQIGLQGSYGTSDLSFGRSISTPVGTFPLDGVQQKATLGLEARQSIYSGGALTAQRDQAKAGVDASQAQLVGAEQQLVLSVVTAFVDVRRAEQEVEIRETNVNSLKQEVQASKDRFQVGEVTRTDVAQAQAREAGAEGDLARSRSTLATARATYERVVGRPPLQLAEPPPAPQLPGTVEEAISIAQGANPDIVAARAQEAAAAKGVGIAVGNLRPKVGLVGSAGLQDTYKDNSFQDTNVGLSAEFSIPLFQSGLLNSKKRGAQLEADKARYQRMAVEREVSARVTSAWHQVIAARESIAASSSRVEAAKTALEGAQQELAVGTRITLDVLDQERELLEAQLGLVDSQRAAYIATHQLLAAMGRLSADQIGH
ncbi:MAG TPA: TolC family outer membrane protein [Hyphomonadaceae bacterium]|nr:TolC family outer membrane protein [Hyphomonadaceae bacterium]